MNLNVIVGQSKRLTIKTDPSTTLRQVVTAVCQHQSYPDPQHHGLRNGTQPVDLSLQIQHLSITPATNLVLINEHKDASATINIALLLEDGSWMTHPFERTTTLWGVLLGFERISNGTLNLTRRIGTPPSSTKSLTSLYRRLSKKGKKQVYMMPVITFLEREYSSIQSQMATTLELAKAESNSLMIRVVMRYMNHGIDKYIEEIERDSSSSTTATLISSSRPPLGGLSETAAGRGPRGSHRAQDARALSLPVDPQGFQFQIPEISERSGSIGARFREGHLGGPGNGAGSGNDNNGGSGDGDRPRQNPTQDINSAMIEATQEIRQLREQQTQEAMTDRVKRLSKSADGSSSDKDRFVRGMDFVPPLMSQPSRSRTFNVTVEGSASHASQAHSEQQVQGLTMSAISSPHEVLVRQIANRVSQQLREAQQRGDSATNYQALIAKEIVKEQKAGALPISPAGSRKNSIDPEDHHARLLKRSTQ